MKTTPIIALFVTLIVGLSLPQSLWAQSVFENPQPGSFQSGVGVISGWACEAERIDVDIFLNAGGVPSSFVSVDIYGGDYPPPPEPDQTYQAAYGTAREDTKEICGDIDNGFGLLFNWNRLGPGTHLVQARADGKIFGTAIVTVTTLGQEFLIEPTGGEFVVEDFPTNGSDVTLRWQLPTQNFAIAAPDTPDHPWEVVRVGRNTGASPPLHTLENPPSHSSQSGVGIISGWVC